MHLNVIMPTESEAKVKEVKKVAFNSVVVKLPSLGFCKLYKDVRFLLFVFVKHSSVCGGIIFLCVIVSSLLRAR